MAVCGGEIKEFTIPPAHIMEGNVSPVDLLAESKLAPSRAEAKRLIQQGAVDLDGRRLADPQAPISLKSGTVLKVGKRQFLKILL